MLMKLMDRWPIIITIGAALLGWVAGDMAATDPVVKDWVDANAAWLHWAAPGGGGRVRGGARQVACRARRGRSTRSRGSGEGSETKAPH